NLSRIAAKDRPTSLRPGLRDQRRQPVSANSSAHHAHPRSAPRARHLAASYPIAWERRPWSRRRQRAGTPAIQQVEAHGPEKSHRGHRRYKRDYRKSNRQGGRGGASDEPHLPLMGAPLRGMNIVAGGVILNLRE